LSCQKDIPTTTNANANTNTDANTITNTNTNSKHQTPTPTPTSPTPTPSPPSPLHHQPDWSRHMWHNDVAADSKMFVKTAHEDNFIVQEYITKPLLAKVGAYTIHLTLCHVCGTPLI